MYIFTKIPTLCANKILCLKIEMKLKVQMKQETSFMDMHEKGSKFGVGRRGCGTEKQPEKVHLLSGGRVTPHDIWKHAHQSCKDSAGYTPA